MQIDLPKGYAICDVNYKNGGIYLWALIDIHAPLEKRNFVIYGTGWQINNANELSFLKTIHMPGGFVWHVFEVNEANTQ